ncbi:MAG TPA: ABC transporter ATP-binding protein [Burkholderiales bacterium]|nr:ABC transporter ATP-binding protein [Burkholderiales bacterium]
MTTSPEAPPALRFTRVNKRYGPSIALDAFSLTVGTGQTFGLVGMNGAGKTTLIKCLLDFLEPDGGAIEIFDVSSHLTRSRSRLAFLPERFNPPYYLTGRDFLCYMLKLQDVAYRHDQAQRTLLALDLDLSALAKPVRAFSKGMTQKLGLVACLLSGKDLYVLDEPTSGLDPKARALLKDQLRAARDEGRTVFFTSHALADVDELCDRMAVIHRGELRFAGTPGELRERHGAATLEQAFLACIGAGACSVGTQASRTTPDDLAE